MPPLSREYKRVAVATLGEAYKLIEKMIVEVRNELAEKGIKLGYRGITLESLKNPICKEKISKMTGMKSTGVKKWRNVGLQADFESNNKENSGRPRSLDANDVKLIKKESKKVSFVFVEMSLINFCIATDGCFGALSD